MMFTEKTSDMVPALLKGITVDRRGEDSYGSLSSKVSISVSNCNLLDENLEEKFSSRSIIKKWNLNRNYPKH